MKGIKKLSGKYPVTTTASSYFTTSFVGTGSVALMCGSSLTNALFVSAIIGTGFGIAGIVKVLDKDNESE